MNNPGIRARSLAYIDRGLAAGARLVLDGRIPEVLSRPGDCFIGPTIFDHVAPGCDLARDEIFGPVLAVVRVASLEEAIKIVNSSRYGNASAIFTRDGKAARTYVSKADVGMLGVNVGVPGPMAFFSFGGRKESIFGDLRAHGAEAFRFYTAAKSITTRWF